MERWYQELSSPSRAGARRKTANSLASEKNTYPLKWNKSANSTNETPVPSYNGQLLKSQKLNLITEEAQSESIFKVLKWRRLECPIRVDLWATRSGSSTWRRWRKRARFCCLISWRIIMFIIRIRNIVKIRWCLKRDRINLAFLRTKEMLVISTRHKRGIRVQVLGGTRRKRVGEELRIELLIERMVLREALLLCRLIRRQVENILNWKLRDQIGKCMPKSLN